MSEIAFLQDADETAFVPATANLYFTSNLSMNRHSGGVRCVYDSVFSEKEAKKVQRMFANSLAKCVENLSEEMSYRDINIARLLLHNFVEEGTKKLHIGLSAREILRKDTPDFVFVSEHLDEFLSIFKLFEKYNQFELIRIETGKAPQKSKYAGFEESNQIATGFLKKYASYVNKIRSSGDQVLLEGGKLISLSNLYDFEYAAFSSQASAYNLFQLTHVYDDGGRIREYESFDTGRVEEIVESSFSDFSSSFLEIIKNSILDVANNFYNLQYNRTKKVYRQFEKTSPDIALLSHLVPSSSQLIIELSDEFGFDTVLVPHGIMDFFNSRYQNIIYALDHDVKVAVNSDKQSKKFYSLGFNNSHINTDFSLFVPDEIENRPINQDNHILVLDYARNHWNIGRNSKHEEEYMKWTIEAIQDEGYENVVYKLHPGRVDKAYMSELADSFGLSGVQIEKNSDFNELLSSAKFVVGPKSTAIVESAIMDVPYLFVHLDDYEYGEPCTNIRQARDKSELAEMIHERKDYWPDTRKKILEYFGCDSNSKDIKMNKNLRQLTYESLSGEEQ